MTKKVKAKLSESKTRGGRTNWAVLKAQNGEVSKKSQPSQKKRG